MNKNLVMAAAVIAIVAAAIVVPNAMAVTGNGAPGGAHYNMNLIGKDKTDILQDDTNNGHRIFVNEFGRSKIYLYEGDFAVLDADATDGRGAFQLPSPNVYDGDGNYVGGAYTVWIRAVGKPGGNGKITTCATDILTTEEVCSTGNVTLDRSNGKQKFQDVTSALTTITYYDAALGRDVTVDIFDPILQDYLWSYDNNGLKIVQMRFYPTS